MSSTTTAIAAVSVRISLLLEASSLRVRKMGESKDLDQPGGTAQTYGISMTRLPGLIMAFAIVAAQPQKLPSHVALVSTAVSGRALVDLGVDDFVVEEGGAPREILDVHIADYPLVVLIDNGTEEVEAIRDAAARFVSRVGERAVAVGTLAEPAVMVASFDDDRSKVLEEIGRVPARPEARLAPLDAVAAAVQAIKDTGSPFSAVVIISARAIAPAELASG